MLGYLIHMVIFVFCALPMEEPMQDAKKTGLLKTPDNQVASVPEVTPNWLRRFNSRIIIGPVLIPATSR
jgi:hypothetical protein